MPYYSLAILLLIALGVVDGSDLTVNTSNGTVQGAGCSSTKSNYFLGIPFANPPVGELRYQAPQPFSGSYNGTLDGAKPAPICYQFGPANIQEGAQSEDCLYLNVYAPANATSASQLPVKIWVYGGSFIEGGSTAAFYDGCFASRDAVIVTVNYRLGPLGYIALENTTLVGNYGALDQLQAVRWVYDNIAAFGGNPEEILLFGQSAGSISTFVLATLPEIKSYIKAVAMESGGGLEIPTISTSQPFYTEYLNALNCTATDVDCVRSKSPATLNSTFNAMLNKTTGLAFGFTVLDWSGAAFPFGPTAGSPLFPVQPAQIGVQVPAIFGSNGLEDSIFVLQTIQSADLSNLTPGVYAKFLEVNFGPFASDVANRYPLSLFGGSVFEAISIVGTYYSFRCPAYRGASLAAAKGIPVWTYNFNQTVSCPWSQGLPADDLRLLGAAHTAEIIFSFGEVDNLPLPNGDCSLSAGEKNISAFMTSSWTNMARDGMPGNDWPGFFPNASLGVNFQDGLVSPGVVDYSMCAFWDNLQPALLKAATAGNTTSANESSVQSHVPPSTGTASTIGTAAICAWMAVGLLMLSTAGNF